MRKRILILSLALVMIFIFSACRDDEGELIKKLYNELEEKTEECTSLRSQVATLTDELEESDSASDTYKYERDAFLEENQKLKSDNEGLQNTVDILEDALSSANYIAGLYRNDLSDIAAYTDDREEFSPYSENVPVDHRDAIDAYFADYIEMLMEDETLLHDPEIIISILGVSPMPAEELHRPARENCKYYKVVYYASRINPYEPEEVYILPRGIFDGLVTFWLVEVENMESGPTVTVFEPNA